MRKTRAAAQLHAFGVNASDCGRLHTEVSDDICPSAVSRRNGLA
jgi:hypothetical protein